MITASQLMAVARTCSRENNSRLKQMTRLCMRMDACVCVCSTYGLMEGLRPRPLNEGNSADNSKAMEPLEGLLPLPAFIEGLLRWLSFCKYIIAIFTTYYYYYSMSLLLKNFTIARVLIVIFTGTDPCPSSNGSSSAIFCFQIWCLFMTS